MINIFTPYDNCKNLGRAYNKAMSLIPDNEYGCLIDYDTMFLLPETITNLHKYVELYPEVAMFICFANRSHPNSVNQLLPSGTSEKDSILHHIKIAREQQQQLYSITETHKHVSGFLMLIKKKVWEMLPFSENMKCLGVDNDFSNRLLERGLPIYRMDGIYVWHTYRLEKGIHDKSHLLL